LSAKAPFANPATNLTLFQFGVNGQGGTDSLSFDNLEGRVTAIMRNRTSSGSAQAWNGGELVEHLEQRRLLSSAYTVTDLGQTASPLPYAPMVINNHGQVIAGYGDVNTGHDPFLYSNGNSTALPATLSRQLRNSNANVLELDDSGNILGGIAGSRFASSASNFGLFGGGGGYRLPDAFIFDGRHLRRLGASFAVARNSSGEIVALSTPVDENWPADGINGRYLGARSVYVFIGRKRLKLTLPSSSKPIVGAAVDDAGNVILVGNGIYRYSPGSKTGVQISSLSLHGVSISPTGVVFGATPDGEMVVFNRGLTTDLGPSTNQSPAVNAVNSFGEVVGIRSVVAFDTLPSYVAVVSQNGAIVDLNTLAPPSETGWTLESATAVNDAGQIAAVGQDAQGYDHYLLLTPSLPGA
jgi:hypothetical protein